MRALLNQPAGTAVTHLLPPGKHMDTTTYVYPDCGLVRRILQGQDKACTAPTQREPVPRSFGCGGRAFLRVGRIAWGNGISPNRYRVVLAVSVGG